MQNLNPLTNQRKIKNSKGRPLWIDLCSKAPYRSLDMTLYDAVSFEEIKDKAQSGNGDHLPDTCPCRAIGSVGLHQSFIREKQPTKVPKYHSSQKYHERPNEKVQHELFLEYTIGIDSSIIILIIS